MPPQTPFQLLGGEEGIRALAAAFYQSMDELAETKDIRGMHAENMDTIKEKLYEYLTGWMGGPPLYSDRTGSVCLTDPHKPYAIGPNERDQWLLCMDAALEKVDASEDVKEMLKDPMYRIADAVRNQDHSNREARDDGVIAVG